MDKLPEVQDLFRGRGQEPQLIFNSFARGGTPGLLEPRPRGVKVNRSSAQSRVFSKGIPQILLCRIIVF